MIRMISITSTSILTLPSNLNDLKFMSDRDWKTYKSLFNNMTMFINKPDLIIYLKASTDTLLSRIKNRDRDFEKNIDPEYEPSMDTCTSPRSAELRTSGTSISASLRKFLFPTKIVFSFKTPDVPNPGEDRNSETSTGTIFLDSHSVTMALAIMCSEFFSTAAAYSKISFAE